MPAYKDKQRKTWYFKLYYTNLYGERKQKLQRGFKTKKEAQDAERTFLNEIERVRGGDLTLQEVFDHRMEHTHMEEGTRYTQEMNFKNHILPQFGDKLISEITTNELSQFKKYLINSGLATNTQSGIYTGLMIIFRYAVNHFYLNDNQTHRVKGISSGKTDIHPIKIEDFQSNVSKIDYKVDKTLCYLLYYTGLRIGEALALTWNDVDLNRNTIKIYKTYDLNRRKIKLKTKTIKSKGVVLLPESLNIVLDDWKTEMQNKYKYFTDDYLLFEAYVPIKYTTFRYRFKRVFPEHRIHDLRHSYASYLANKGVELSVLKELMRHESIKTTSDTYSHIYEDKKRKAIEFFNE